MFTNKTEVFDVLVIGCGGAGLRAGIEVSENNLSVKIIGKRSKNDAHTVLAAGGINASFGNLDSKDSWEQHFADTFIEGYKIGDPEAIEIMAKNAPYYVAEIDRWGGNFDKLPNGLLNQRYFGAHTYRRTCFSGDYTGQSILKTLIKKTTSLNIPIDDSQYVTELLVENGQCFGAMAFNIINGTRTVYLANSIILCTGGHTRIWKKSSSRELENNGDGFFLALNAGCELIDMEMVQFHPTGMVTPEDKVGTLVTEAVRGEGGILLNKDGERFMINYDKERMELSTRDKVASAIYSEILNGRGLKNGGVLLDITHKNKEFILSKLPKIYNQFLDYQKIDISMEPMEVAPTAHYSMGGILVNAIDHSTKINGLFAAGEVVGGLHGANRLGGNSLAEILVFGAIAGKNAVKYSKNHNGKKISNKIINLAHQNINKLIRKGDGKASKIEKQLRDIMWAFCGVVKNEKYLKKGLSEIEKLKKRFKNIDCDLKDENFVQLANIFNLRASLTTAEATIISALSRKESRGSHNRSDFPSLNNDFNFNTKVELIGSKLILNLNKFKKINNNLKDILLKTKEINNFNNKLIE